MSTRGVIFVSMPKTPTSPSTHTHTHIHMRRSCEKKMWHAPERDDDRLLLVCPVRPVVHARRVGRSAVRLNLPDSLAPRTPTRVACATKPAAAAAASPSSPFTATCPTPLTLPRAVMTTTTTRRKRDRGDREDGGDRSCHRLLISNAFGALDDDLASARASSLTSTTPRPYVRSDADGRAHDASRMPATTTP